MDLNIKKYNGRDIRINPNTRYVCLTDMANANGKLFGHWQELKGSSDYLEALSASIALPIAELLFVGEGNLGTWAHPKVAIRFAQWCSIDFAIQVDSWIDELLTKGVVEICPTVEQDRQKLEVAAAPVPSLSQIDQAARMLGKRFGAAYEQRYLPQKLHKYYPALGGEEPAKEERASLPTARALLTPTQIATELGFTHKTGSGNGAKVNTLLKDLGYQEMIAGRWSATTKSIEAGLVDRKPVETNSRTQKDQLLWSASVIDILKEHCLPGELAS